MRDGGGMSLDVSITFIEHEKVGSRRSHLATPSTLLGVFFSR